MFDSFYGLTANPFEPAPDPAFYFSSAAQRKALSYLEYGLAQGEPFVVVIGEAGIGLTTLVVHLTGIIDPDRLTVAQIAGRQGAGEIAASVARAFGLEIAGHEEASLAGALEAFFHVEARAGRRCLVIVDRAQDLSAAALEELHALSSVRTGSDPLLQTLLFGGPQLGTALQAQPSLEPGIAAHRLGALTKAEIERYVTHRLERAGWQGTPQFDQRVFAELHEASGGNPRAINRLADRLLLLGAVERRSRIDSGLLNAVRGEAADEAAAPEPAPRPEPRSAPRIDPKLIENLLAERDAQIAELQQAIVELSTQRDRSLSDAVRPELAAMQDHVARVEAKLLEQERTIRQTLTMLIEWIEAEAEPAQAA